MANQWGRAECVVLTLLCGAYAASFAARSMVSLATLDMTRDKSLGIDVSVISNLNARGVLGGACGKLFGGALTDKLGGRNSLTAILATMCACFLALAKAVGPTAGMTTAFIISRTVHAAAWPACTLVIKDWFRNNGQSTALGFGASASRGGAWLGSVLGGLLLARIKNWRGLLTVSALTCGTLAAMTAAGLGKDGKSEDNKEGSKKPSKSMGVREALLLGARTPKLWFLYSSNMVLTPSFDFGTILPQYLSDTYALDDATIGSIAGMFPLAAPPAIMAGSMVLTRCTDRQKTAFLVCMEVCSIAGYLILAKRPPSAAVGPTVAVIMAGISPALYCCTPDWVLRWGGPYSGLFSGLSDVPGNLFTMFMYTVLPRLLKAGGWPLILRLYALQIAIGTCSILTWRALEAANPTVSSPFEEEGKKKA